MCSTLTPDDDSTYNIYNRSNPRLQRQRNENTVTFSEQINFTDDTHLFDFIEHDDELTDIDDYTPTQDFLSPFTSDGVLTLMREISGNHTIGNTIANYEENDEETTV